MPLLRLVIEKDKNEPKGTTDLAAFLALLSFLWRLGVCHQFEELRRQSLQGTQIYLIVINISLL